MTKRNDGVSDMNGILIVGGSISQKVFKDFVATINFNDIFKSWKVISTNSLNAINRNSTYFTDAHEISLSLKYNFGKQFKSNYKNKDIDDNLKRIN